MCQQAASRDAGAPYGSGDLYQALKPLVMCFIKKLKGKYIAQGRALCPPALPQAVARRAATRAAPTKANVLQTLQFR